MGGIVLLVQNKSRHERVKSLFFLRGQLVEIQHLKGMLTHPSRKTTPGSRSFTGMVLHSSSLSCEYKRVRIDIYFTGVGLVNLATIKEMLAIAESSRP